MGVRKIEASDRPAIEHFKVKEGSCENPIYYSIYLKERAISYTAGGYELTFALFNNTQTIIGGYITLRVTSLIETYNDNEIYGNPALEILNLAVDERFTNRKFGTNLVTLAKSIANKIKKNYAGIQYILALSDPKAIGFYEKEGFAIARSNYQAPKDIVTGNQDCELMVMKLN